MRENESTFGDFEDVSGDDFDIDAIFGTSTAGETPPEPIPEPEPATEAAEKIAESESKEAPQSEASQETEEATSEATEEPDIFAAFNGSQDTAIPASPVEAASSQVSLFDKPPVFKYGSAKEPIEDSSMTFEELRIRKADDFPELEDGKKVTWSVRYGDITKLVPNPKDTTIAKMKEEIEKSKAFLDALKKAKEKNPDCLVIPRVSAGSKGIASYKGFYPSVDAARRSDKVINLIPARNGKIYELRKTEMGEFIAPKDKIVDFEEVRAGFTPALPLIPRELMGQIVSFFRSFMNVREELEALVFIYWDRVNEEFVLHVPKQRTSKAHIDFEVEDSAFPEERYLHYADIHSHNSMAAKFSSVDDADEMATRLYLVVGRLDKFYPDITARVSCGGTFIEIDPSLVIEDIGEEFPVDWLDKVEHVTADERKARFAELEAMFR